MSNVHLSFSRRCLSCTLINHLICRTCKFRPLDLLNHKTFRTSLHMLVYWFILLLMLVSICVVFATFRGQYCRPFAELTVNLLLQLQLLLFKSRRIISYDLICLLKCGVDNNSSYHLAHFKMIILLDYWYIQRWSLNIWHSFLFWYRTCQRHRILIIFVLSRFTQQSLYQLLRRVLGVLVEVFLLVFFWLHFE